MRNYLKGFIFVLSIVTWSAEAQVSDDMCIGTVDWPFEFESVYKHNYEKNDDVEYCTRPTEMIDTIVLHHSATSPNRSADYLNSMHLNEGYHMIGYSYVVQSSYTEGNGQSPTITEGRPIDMVGSHAGGGAYVPMTKRQNDLWDDGKVICKSPGSNFRVNSKYVQGNKILANVTTIGVVVVGNYAPLSFSNLDGYVGSRVPTATTLKTIAGLACQIQKKYPSVTKLSWHGMYRKTQCPGDQLVKNVDKIKAYAKDLGCNF